MTHFFYSLISFLIAIFFILLGLIGVLIPWSENVRAEVITLINEHSIAISLFGLSFMTIGIAVMANIIINSKTSYHHFTLGKNFVSVDESIIQRYLNEYWKELFSGQEIPHRITLKDNKINITADLPYLQQQQQGILLAKIEQELTELFSDILGYRQQFSLSVSFQAEPPLGPASALSSLK